jgi:hypothetical protein
LGGLRLRARLVRLVRLVHPVASPLKGARTAPATHRRPYPTPREARLDYAAPFQTIVAKRFAARLRIACGAFASVR